MMELIGDGKLWTPVTSGERLLILLLRHHEEWRVLADLLNGVGLRLGRRFGDLANFFVGASVLHLQQRLIKMAHDVRDAVPLDRLAQVSEVRVRLCDIVQLTPIEYTADFGNLVQEVLTSAEQMPKEPSTALKRQVIRSGPAECYSCGRTFGAIYEDGPGPRGLQATADHIWPRALGGDTVEANLLPACASCNNTKGHLAAWQMAWIQPVVFATCDQVSGLNAIRREVKMALHMRAAMTYARSNGTTLRDAFLTIGPREAPIRIDDDQGYDFFNLRVHDEARTNVAWTPS